MKSFLIIIILMFISCFSSCSFLKINKSKCNLAIDYNITPLSIPNHLTEEKIIESIDNNDNLIINGELSYKDWKTIYNALKKINRQIKLILNDITLIEYNSFFGYYQNITNLKYIEQEFELPIVIEIEIPKATEIENYAFSGCDLHELKIPEVIKIGDGAFSRCSSLWELKIPKAIIIGEEAFYESVLKSIELPNAIKIGDGAFSGCQSLQSIELPEAIIIGYDAFSGCQSLQTIKIPKAIKIEDGAFAEVPTKQCNLIISNEQYANVEDNNNWGGYTWKSITTTN